MNITSKNYKLTTIFAISLIIFAMSFTSSCTSKADDVKLQLRWQPFKDGSGMQYIIQNVSDFPVEIKDYKLNRGNLLSMWQQLGSKFDPFTLNYGQSRMLFSMPIGAGVVEVTVITDKGDITFKEGFNNYN